MNANMSNSTFCNNQNQSIDFLRNDMNASKLIRYGLVKRHDHSRSINDLYLINRNQFINNRCRSTVPSEFNQPKFCTYIFRTHQRYSQSIDVTLKEILANICIFLTIFFSSLVLIMDMRKHDFPGSFIRKRRYRPLPKSLKISVKSSSLIYFRRISCLQKPDLETIFEEFRARSIVHMVIAHSQIELAQIKKLLYAVRTCDYDQVKRICEKGAKGIVNSSDPTDGQTPLLAAVKNNDEIMIKFLLDLGANPDITDFQSRTPLIHAARQGFVESLVTLLDANARIDIHDLDGNDILFACLSDGTNRQQECFSLLLSKRTCDINGTTAKGKPLLIAACENGLSAEKLCLMLIERGADVNVIDKETGRTALHAACASGLISVVRELLQQGANVNARDSQQQTPAHAAITSKIFELLPILSAYNARFDLADQTLNTPVHLAARLNQGKAIKFLIQRGASTKTKNIDNQLPIKIAKILKNKNARKAIRLADKKHYQRSITSTKSNPNRDYKIQLYDWLKERSDRLRRRFQQVENSDTHRITSNDFRRIIHDEGFTQITSEDLNDLIVQHETNPNEIDYQKFLTGKLFIEKAFLQKPTTKKKKQKRKKTKKQVPLPIATRDEGPRTAKGNPPVVYVKKHQFITDRNRFDRDHIPKHILNDDSVYYLDQTQPEYVHINNAAHRGDLHTLLDAFKSGVSVDIRDKYYKTPLMIAAANGDLETTEFLLQCGANVHLEDQFKWTALHHAAHSGQLGVVRALINAGAKVNHESITSATPLSRAIESSALDVIEYLLEKRANVRHENITQRNLLDLAADFSSPQVFNAVRTAYESKSKKKDNQQVRNRRKSKTKNQKPTNLNLSHLPIKPVKIEAPLPRRGSLLSAEEKLLSNDDASQSITYHPLTQWTDQPTTNELLDKKIDLREKFTMNIDFLDYKIPLLANAQTKLR